MRVGVSLSWSTCTSLTRSRTTRTWTTRRRARPVPVRPRANTTRATAHSPRPAAALPPPPVSPERAPVAASAPRGPASGGLALRARAPPAPTARPGRAPRAALPRPSIDHRMGAPWPAKAQQRHALHVARGNPETKSLRAPKRQADQVGLSSPRRRRSAAASTSAQKLARRNAASHRRPTAAAIQPRNTTGPSNPARPRTRHSSRNQSAGPTLRRAQPARLGPVVSRVFTIRLRSLAQPRHRSTIIAHRTLHPPLPRAPP